jgi:hypothetical protein
MASQTATAPKKRTRIAKPPGIYDVAPQNETKEAKRVRLAKRLELKLLELSAKRVTKACNAITLVGNLATYRPTEEDAEKIMKELTDACMFVAQRLAGVKRDKTKFTLREVKVS